MSDHDAELLRYVGSLGLYPETPFEVVSVAPFDGPISVRVASDVHPVGFAAAQHIFVKPAA